MTSRRIYLFDVAVEWNIFLSWREMNNFDLTLSPYIFERQPFFFSMNEDSVANFNLVVRRETAWMSRNAGETIKQPATSTGV